MIVTLSQFRRFQEIFYRKVSSSPLVATLKVNSVIPGSTSFQDFVGDSPRNNPVSHTIPCLFEEIKNDRQREKYGLHRTVNYVVWISPKQVESIFGSYTIDINTVSFTMQKQNCVINKVNYLEEMYNSCVGIELHLTDSLKGG